MSPWDDCICGHTFTEHDTDDGGCAINSCPCPWFDLDRDCPECVGLSYGCNHPTASESETAA